MNLTVETEQEADGRWIAEIPQIPGAMAYGADRQEAISQVKALALRILAEREDWHVLSKAGLARAYSDDQPDYPTNLVRERAARRGKFERVLSKVPDVEPEAHDRLSPRNTE